MLTTVRSAVLLHFCLKQVALAVDELVSGTLFERLERGVVMIVIVLDDLECPTSLDDVPAQHVKIHLVSERIMSRLPKQLNRLTQGEIRRSRQPVESIQEPPRVLHYFKRLREFPERFHCLVRGRCRPLVIAVRPVRI